MFSENVKNSTLWEENGKLIIFSRLEIFLKLAALFDNFLEIEDLYSPRKRNEFFSAFERRLWGPWWIADRAIVDVRTTNDALMN